MPARKPHCTDSLNQIRRLTPEFLRECFDYCENTGLLYWEVRPLSHFDCEQDCNTFNKLWPGTEAGRSGPDGYKMVRIALSDRTVRLRVHHVLWVYHGNAFPEGHLIDHRDRNRKNNKITNLRLCTEDDNLLNKSTYKSNKSGTSGVHLMHTGKWRARISKYGKRMSLGVYDTKEEAEAARNAAEVKYFGEFRPDQPFTFSELTPEEEQFVNAIGNL